MILQDQGNKRRLEAYGLYRRTDRNVISNIIAMISGRQTGQCHSGYCNFCGEAYSLSVKYIHFLPLHPHPSVIGPYSILLCKYRTIWHMANPATSCILLPSQHEAAASRGSLTFQLVDCQSLAKKIGDIHRHLIDLR